MMDKETEALIARLRGFQSDSEERTIQALVERASDELVDMLGAKLPRAVWPLCVSLATTLSRIGGEKAKAALIQSLSARKHHNRTAAVNALVAMGDASVCDLFEPLLDDPAYETREAARDGIIALTGREVKTARGE